MREITHEQWVSEGTERFGADPMKWRFACPACGFVASVEDWKDAGAEESTVAFSCVGRFRPKREESFTTKKRTGGPCDYAGGGLFRLNPVRVTMGDGKAHDVFEWGPTE